MEKFNQLSFVHVFLPTTCKEPPETCEFRRFVKLVLEESEANQV